MTYKNNLLKKSIRNIFQENICFSDLHNICEYQWKKYSWTNMYINKFEKNNLGVPVSLKDVFLYKNHPTTAGSKMLENFISPFSSSLVEKLLNHNFFINGKTNLDEFAMGSTGITSYFGMVKSIWKSFDGKIFSSGGSSSGSAMSVATGAAFASLATDTSGSIRLPASWSGIIGFKPTYGVFSRYGTIPLAESFDTMGILTRLVDDVRFLFDILKGKDPLDLTSVNYKEKKSSKKKFAILKEAYETNETINNLIKETENIFLKEGYEKKEFSIKEIHLAIGVYVILSRAECASNLQKYDGLKFGFSSHSNNLELQYLDTRTNGFGLEMKRRILTGGFVTSSENIKDYVEKASKIRQIIKNKILNILEEVDFILTPTSMGAMTLEECENINLQDPINIQKCDLFTVLANISACPAISIPIGLDERGSPVGVDIMGQPFQDLQIMDFGELIEKHFKRYEILFNKIIGETL